MKVAVCGTVLFSFYFFGPINAYGQFKLLHEFAGGANDGAQPHGFSLIEDQLFGTTKRGGDDNAGVVYRIGADDGDYHVLHEFTGRARKKSDLVDERALPGGRGPGDHRT